MSANFRYNQTVHVYLRCPVVSETKHADRQTRHKFSRILLINCSFYLVDFFQQQWPILSVRMRVQFWVDFLPLDTFRPVTRLPEISEIWRMIISGIPGIHVPVFKGGSWVWQVTESKLLSRIS